MGKSGNTTNTTTHNRDFPAQHNRQVTTPATRCVHPSAYRTCRVAGVRTLHALVCPSRPHVGLLFRVWAVSSSRGPAIPSLGNPAHVRNRRPTCETAGSHAGRVGTQVTVAHSQSMTDHGAATHRPAMQHSQERGKHHHLQQQLSHATKPKSHRKTNTFHPITLVSYNPEPSGPTHMEGTAGSTSTPHPEPAQAAQATTKPRDSKGIPGQGAETAGFEPARGYAPLPP